MKISIEDVLRTLLSRKKQLCALRVLIYQDHWKRGVYSRETLYKTVISATDRLLAYALTSQKAFKASSAISAEVLAVFELIPLGAPSFS